MKELAINLVSTLPRLFGDELDRLTMWERIGNGVTVAIKKCGGDTDVFLTQLLDHILANKASLASCEQLQAIIFKIDALEAGGKKLLLQTLETKLNVILVYARLAWKERTK